MLSWDCWSPGPDSSSFAGQDGAGLGTILITWAGLGVVGSPLRCLHGLGCRECLSLLLLLEHSETALHVV